MRSKIWVASALLALLACDVTAAEYTKATIYYYDWDARVRSRLTIDDVRKRFSTKLEISEPSNATTLARSLPSTSDKEALPSTGTDVRLVIDLRSSDGTVTTVFASQFRLYSHGGGASVEIDDAFKNRFRLLANACTPGQ